MSEMLAQYWWLLVFALLLGVVVAWWVFAVNDRTRIESTRPTDVLDEGAAPAQRNQALIDAPPAAARAQPEPARAPPPQDIAATQAVSATATGTGDDLTRLKGVGPKLSARLSELGVTSFAQIAAWSEADIDRIDGQLGTFSGRIRRDNWPEQARLLAAGDTAAFEEKFGRL